MMCCKHCEISDMRIHFLAYIKKHSENCKNNFHTLSYAKTCTAVHQILKCHWNTKCERTLL